MRVVAALPVALASLGCGVALGASGGGIGAPQPPTLTDVTCQNRCVGIREAVPGSRVQLTGRNLEYAAKVSFTQKGGGRVDSEAQNVTPTALEAIVPDEAVTGKPQVVDGGGNVADSPVELKIAPETEVVDQNGTGISEVFAAPAKGYFMGKQQATASFVTQGDSPQDVRVDVVHSDGSVVRSIVAENVAPQSPAEVKWNGKAEDGSIAPNGEYEFDVKPLSGGNGSRARFEQYDHIFPVVGKHEYWAGLGDGRGHQGVDVGAKCGKRIIAARGGKVQHKAYHGAAGNYVVVDGKGTDVDYMYAHLQQPSKLSEGDKVKTGGRIGRNGDTGNASGCHLHFEMWKGGWYEGGSVMDPMPHLKRWDDWS
jgi:murein DD-endopeptidase MepM/ murein hydrolase activator NlpD